MTRFIELFDIARDYTSQLHSSVHSHVFIAVAWKQLPMADVPLLQGSQTVPGLSFQLLTATDHKDWTAVVLELTHQPSNSQIDWLVTYPAYNI
jgi:hypothetical protein